MKTIVKALARWIIGKYTAKAVGLTLDLAADKVAHSDKVQRVAKWCALTAGALSSYAVTLEDGTVTEEEKAEVVAKFDVLAQELAALIKE